METFATDWSVWRSWYAWRPVPLINGEWRWLKTIERRWKDDVPVAETWSMPDPGFWEYRDRHYRA